jgi:hypothetical protein
MGRRLVRERQRLLDQDVLALLQEIADQRDLVLVGDGQDRGVVAVRGAVPCVGVVSRRVEGIGGGDAALPDQRLAPLPDVPQPNDEVAHQT